jgi:hypothetical protein
LAVGSELLIQGGLAAVVALDLRVTKANEEIELEINFFVCAEP